MMNGFLKRSTCCTDFGLECLADFCTLIDYVHLSSRSSRYLHWLTWVYLAVRPQGSKPTMTLPGPAPCIRRTHCSYAVPPLTVMFV